MQQPFATPATYISKLESRSAALEDIVADNMAHTDSTIAIEGAIVCTMCQPHLEDTFETTWEELINRQS